MILDNQVAIVTGGATGIGKAIALALAAEGADIVVADLNKKIATKTAAEIEALGVKSIAVVCDVTKPWMVKKLGATAIEKLGRLDILINNAGVAGGPGWYEHARSREEDWIACYEVNVKGIFNCIEAIAPIMKEQRSGKIVNLASIAGREGRPALPHYSASKAAVINYTQSLAADMAPYDINVNAVCPGLLWTPMWGQVGQRYAQTNPDYAEMPAREVFDKMVADIIPLGREQTPEDIGDCVVFLVSEDARNITGQAINVDGGAFMR
ncbi:MAG: SDR family oxidoreductase [Chloroflexi bacterium]|nr:SDR family oxidoreductase [Chloroflexota bacterium]